MIGSRFQPRASGVGFIPIILAAASIGAGIWQQKQQEKSAEEQAKAAAENADRVVRQSRKGSSLASSKWVWIAGGAAVLGVGAWFLMRRKR